MRFILIDAALRNNEGHHANSCRLILQAAHERGIETKVLGNVEVEPALAAELKIVPHFRIFPYRLSDGDPICGWLNAFHSTTTLTTQDLAQISDITSEDVVFFNSVQPAQLMAAVNWLSALRADKRPRTVIEFGTGVKLAFAMTPNGPTLTLPEPRADATGLLFHFVGGQMQNCDLGRFHLVTYHETTSKIMQALLGQRVEVTPFPYQAASPPRNRARTRPITVGLLGYQREDKGYQLLPKLLPVLLASGNEIRFLVHNSGYGYMPETDRAVAAVAAQDSRVTLDTRVVSAEDWNRLIDRSDLILCPYDGTRYLASHSGIAVEAIANAVPLVVPSRTPLADIAAEYGAAATCFDGLAIDDIAAAVKRAVSDFDTQAEIAMQAADRWAKTQGAHNMLDAILGLPN